MATRSAIGYINIDGTVTGTYCHWDGYPSTMVLFSPNPTPTLTRFGS